LCAACEPAVRSEEAGESEAEERVVPPWPDRDFVRVATFNIQELDREKIFQRDESGIGTHPQARAAATIIQRIRPDVIVLNEVDHYWEQGVRGLSAYAHRFVDFYLKTGEAPLDYPYVLIAPNNTGVLSGLDLNGDGKVATEADRGSREYGEDAWGFGTYRGQYAMVALSRYPMDGAGSRTFRSFLWKDLPGHHMPPDFYSAEAEAALPLSSKSHWDLPIVIDDDQILHVWASHPTPPVFDGDEDRNGRRNFDEIRFWALYLEGAEALYDDQGRSGGFSGEAPFLIAGDLNAQPGATESRYDGIPAVAQLLDHPRIQDPGDVTQSRGALQGRAPGAPDYLERATASFLGGVRVDYLLPSSDLEVVGGGVFWPDPDDDAEGAALAEAASDHRMVWIDVVLPAGSP
jgi:endonuclease/exonuclease/phosphatase family metal-dependent hydrolase